MINFFELITEKTTKHHCIIKSIKFFSNNKLQINNSSNKKDATIIRTGAWDRGISLVMSVRDDIHVSSLTGDESGATNDEASLVELKIKIDNLKAILKNDGTKKRKIGMNILSKNETNAEDFKLLSLLRIMNDNFASEVIIDDVKYKKIELNIDSISYRTDVSNNITDITVTGTFFFRGKFSSSSFSEVVLKDG